MDLINSRLECENFRSLRSFVGNMAREEMALKEYLVVKNDIKQL